jgi:type IV pilus assembly protein PilM
MPKTDTLLAIDVGSDSLKMAEFNYPPTGKLVLEKFTFKEFGGDLKEEDLLPAIKNALKAAFEENQFSSKTVNISITGQSSFIRFAKLPPIGGQENRVRQVVEFEAKQNVPFPINEVVWDYQLISEPGADAEIEVMFVVAKNDFIEEITSAIEEFSKGIKIVDIAPIACYNAARANEIGGQDCVMLLNIGSRCSSLVFIDSGKFFVRTIPIAGQTITQQISKEFGIPYNDAEELKRKHGFVALGGAYEEPDSEVAATISKIIRNVMTKLHGEVNRSINVYRSQQKGNKPAKLYLAGGSSVMAFTPRFFQEKLKIPCEYFNAFQVVSLSDSIAREKLAEVAHMFSEVIGLGLRNLTVCPIEISLLPQKIKRMHEIQAKAPFFYGSAASLVLCSALIFSSLKMQSARDEKLIVLGEDEVAKTRILQTEIKTVHNKLGAVKLSYATAAKKLANRSAWPNLLNALQGSLPDNMWLIKISHGSDPALSSTPSTTEPSREEAPRFAFFKKAATGKTTTEDQLKKLEWLEIEGYFMGKTELEIVAFKQNLVKSGIFSDKIEDLHTAAFEPAKGDESVSSFKLTIKLKNPMDI